MFALMNGSSVSIIERIRAISGDTPSRLISVDPDEECAPVHGADRAFGELPADDIERAWIAGRAVMPALAGLMLSMALIVWPRRR